MKKTIFIIFVIIILSGCSGAKYQIETKFNEAIDYVSKPFISETNLHFEKPKSNSNQIQQNENQKLPDSVEIDMVFTSQAPFANWDELHDEACEEAALLTVHYYLSEKKSISKKEADNEIIDMVDWQIKNYGGHHDLTISQLSDFAKKYYGYKNINIIKDVEIDDIKRELSKGNPVIVPCAGRMLDNPYFRQPGPIYHMLVIKGYDAKYFITNDVGTKRGEGFKYKFKNLYNAIHDFTEKSEEEMKKGSKTVLVIREEAGQ